MKFQASTSLVLVAVFLMLLLIACDQVGQEMDSAQGESDSEDADSGTGAVSGPTWTPLVTLSQAADGAEVAAVERAGSLLSVDVEEMLGSLGSHGLSIDVAFDGQDASGAPVAFEWQTDRTLAVEPPGYRLEVEAFGDLPEGGVRSLVIVENGGLSYLYLPGIGCISGRAGEFSDYGELPLGATELLAGLSGAELVSEGVLLDGLPVSEYHFDEDALAWSSAGPWSIDGKAFVGESSGLLVRALMSISGQGNLLNQVPFVNGTYQIVIDVADLEESAAVEVPESCENVLPYPVTVDAFDLAAIDDLLAFKSRFSLAELVDYYLAEMPISGWELVTEPEVFEDLAILNYERNGRQVMISVEYDPETETAEILISP